MASQSPPSKSQKKKSHKHRDRKNKSKSRRRKERSRSRSRQSRGSKSESGSFSSKVQNRAERESGGRGESKCFPSSSGIKPRINSNMLANIISAQKTLNKNLDLEQTTRAANKFRQKFREEIKPVTMSSFLSNEQLVKKVQAKSQGLTCSVCDRLFEHRSDLEEHLGTHS